MARRVKWLVGVCVDLVEYIVYMLNAFLVFLLVITTLLSFDNAQGVIFPLAIVIILFQKRIRSWLMGLSVGVTFMGIGVSLGLLTEIFAIISNSALPNDKKILLHPDPCIDLLIGCFYYSFVIVTWYFLLQRYSFTKKTVFILSGMLGVLTEQSGAIFLGIFTNPLVGVPMALIIACVYALFPTVAYVLSEQQFSSTRLQPKYYHYALAALMLFVQWAIFGNFVYPLFIEMFPK